MQTGLPRLATRALVAAYAVMATACSLSYDAKNTFAYAYFCPPDSITVAERTDLYRPIVIPGYEMPPPPPEVQADPKRLAYYVEMANKARRPEQTIDYPTSLSSIYEVQGCGHRETYLCSRDSRKRCSVRR